MVVYREFTSMLLSVNYHAGGYVWNMTVCACQSDIKVLWLLVLEIIGCFWGQIFRPPSPPPLQRWSDGMRCCKSDWLRLRFFLFMLFSTLLTNTHIKVWVLFASYFVARNKVNYEPFVFIFKSVKFIPPSPGDYQNGRYWAQLQGIVPAPNMGPEPHDGVLQSSGCTMSLIDIIHVIWNRRVYYCVCVWICPTYILYLNYHNKYQYSSKMGL